MLYRANYVYLTFEMSTMLQADKPKPSTKQTPTMAPIGPMPAVPKTTPALVIPQPIGAPAPAPTAAPHVPVTTATPTFGAVPSPPRPGSVTATAAAAVPAADTSDDDIDDAVKQLISKNEYLLKQYHTINKLWKDSNELVGQYALTNVILLQELGQDIYFYS